MRLLVTGSRQWINQAQLYDELDHARDGWVAEQLQATAEPDLDGFIVVHGGAPGADTLAGQWTHDRRTLSQPPVQEVHPANWKMGPIAGNVRNHEMVILGADLVIGFLVPSAANRGTRHCLAEAKTWLGFKGVPIKEIWEE